MPFLFALLALSAAPQAQARPPIIVTARRQTEDALAACLPANAG